MRRKNWVIPGFLVLAVLLLFSFPGHVSAEDNGAPTAVGEEVTAVAESEPVSQEPAGDVGEQTDADTVPAQDDANQDLASDESTDTGSAPENLAKDVADDVTAPEKPVSTDPVKGDTAVGDSGNQAADIAKPTENPAPEPGSQDSSGVSKPEVKPISVTKQTPAETVKPSENPLAEPEKGSEAPGSEQQNTGEYVSGEPADESPANNQGGIKPAPVIVIPKDIPVKQGYPTKQTEPDNSQPDYVVQAGDTVKKIS